MVKKILVNSLMFKIITTVIIGILTLSISLSVVNLTISKRIFINNFADTQVKIFNQIDESYYKFYSDVVSIMETVGRNKDLKTYFTNEGKDTLFQMNNRFNIEQSVKKTTIYDYDNLRVFAINNNAKSYIFSRSDMFFINENDIWESDIAKNARENKGKIVCNFEEEGFTNVTKNTPVLIFAKAWSYNLNDDIDMIVFITIKESEITKMYSHFTSSTSDIVLFNENNEVISSNNRDYLKGDSELVESLTNQVESLFENNIFKEEVFLHRQKKVYLTQRLQSSDYKIVGIISPDKAFKEQYNILSLIIPMLVITSIIVILISIFIKQQTNPIRQLANIMRNSSNEHFKKQVLVEGTYEVRELAETYNLMVVELQKHIEKLVTVEKDKRLAEIYALQMQINPHYMYNTLSSIKWLVWQGNSKKTIEVLDAFILLLRNVISNTDECVTVEQEIENLKNYCLVNRARYGDSIKVEFFIMQKCMKYEIPKLILQPIVENAFFHGFPEGGEGSICIFLKEELGILKFDIKDNGVGIKKDRLVELNNKSYKKSNGFSSIGIDNVDDRLKLLYGNNYGISIKGVEGEGTIVTITLPVRKKE